LNSDCEQIIYYYSEKQRIPLSRTSTKMSTSEILGQIVETKSAENRITTHKQIFADYDHHYQMTHGDIN